MVTVQTAVANAIEFSSSTMGSVYARTARLEEIESGTLDGQPTWLVTLSFVDPEVPPGVDPFTFDLGTRRIYKLFTISQESGQVHSMKIREFAHR